MKIFSMFDGVGGFIIGLNAADDTLFNTVYSNQYEPARKSQDAYEVGLYRFPDMTHDNRDVQTIPDEDFEALKEQGIDMITGGFPCQDYSVARSSKNELGIKGKKGVLFWEIIRATKIINPKYLILENVDRLLKAPSNQRGRDFAVMLAAFNELNYSVEWRVINAAEYGRAQRRRRVFFFIYRNDLPYAEKIDKQFENKKIAKDIFGEEIGHRYKDYIFNSGLFAKQFPVEELMYKDRHTYGRVDKDIVEISDEHTGRMWNSGIMRHGRYYTYETRAIKEEPITLSEIVQSEEVVDEKYYLSDEKLDKFKYLKGAKKKKRVSESGHEYTYSEGGMSLNDSLNKPGRTMLTSEGTTNRSTHVLKIDDKYRFITPVEAERMQDFPDNWTKWKKDESGNVSEVSDRMRLFFMGNALVTGIVKRIGEGIKDFVIE